MQTYPTFGTIFVTCAAFAAISQAGEISSPDKSQDDPIAIERLHQQDVEATLSDDADQLAKLWDENAIRLQAGAPPEVGKATIYSNDKRWQANLHGGRTLSYKPDLKDLQIVDGWAFEWDTFEVRYRESEHGKEATLHSKALRVLKRQTDGSWKFARVMVLIDSPKPPGA
jgi:ketosteroid isomerase-like protein